MKLRDLLKDSEIIKSEIDLETEVTGITLDTRKGCEGALYAALPSLSDPTRHGKDYIRMAREGGARCVLLDVTCDTCGLPAIYVKDARRAEAFAASSFYGDPAKKMKMIGVTGTKGKTSTTHFIKAVLDHAGIKAGLIGTNEMTYGDVHVPTVSTTPEATVLYKMLAEMAENGCEAVVMEVSSHALDVGRVAPIRFASAAFLNLSQDHLDYFQSMENLARAKEKLGEISDVIYINADDKAAERMKAAAGDRARTFAIDHANASIVAMETKLAPNGVVFDALTDYGMRRVRIGTPGRFTVYNGLAAIGCLLGVGLTLDQIAEGLSAAPGVRGRAEVVETGSNYTVMIDYAHSPDSIREILAAVRPHTEGRIILVFGCGGNRDKLKRPVMGEIAAQNADVVVVTSDNPRFEEPDTIIDEIIAGTKEGKARVLRESDRAEAVYLAMKEARKNDLVLIAGKGHEDYQEIKGVKHHMDDRELIQEAAERLKK